VEKLFKLTVPSDGQNMARNAKVFPIKELSRVKNLTVTDSNGGFIEKELFSEGTSF
jgi:hypothetical protein